MMYTVMIEINDKKNKKLLKREFPFGEIDTGSYRDQMNEIADYLYEQDFDFDVDEDGDMVIDDILMDISEQEEFTRSITGRGFVCKVTGTSELKRRELFKPGLEQVTGI